MEKLQRIIEDAWENRANINTKTKGKVRKAVVRVIDLLDSGVLRVAIKLPDELLKESKQTIEHNHGWVVNPWVKKAVLLYFKLHNNDLIGLSGDWTMYFDKVPLKFTGWKAKRFAKAGIRVAPPAVVRKGVHIAPGTVLMPSYVNIGAYVGEGSMVDTWATVGSCAQIGKNVHISGGAGIGGVLEPLQANPVIIEDGAFIGARSEVAEGVMVGQGAVLTMGVYLSASTKIIDRATGEIHQGYVPPYSVVVPGTLPSEVSEANPLGVGLYCAVIVKTVDAQTRDKVAINEILRS